MGFEPVIGPHSRGRSRETSLLLCERDRELAVAHARRQAFDEFCHRILAIGADQFGERRKQARLRETIARPR